MTQIVSQGSKAVRRDTALLALESSIYELRMIYQMLSVLWEEFPTEESVIALDHLMATIEGYEQWRQQIKTYDLNRELADLA